MDNYSRSVIALIVAHETAIAVPDRCYTGEYSDKFVTFRAVETESPGGHFLNVKPGTVTRFYAIEDDSGNVAGYLEIFEDAAAFAYSTVTG